MSNDHDAQWLRDRMQELGQRRQASATSFERVWGAARRCQAASDAKPGWPSLTLAGASFAVLFLAAVLTLHIVAERRHDREREREFAAVDGVLMTYWQAPSDDLLPVRHDSDLPHRDE
ncbi:MAG TPA: hypothetical protein VK961_12240 [Chthoniobacter sp.]|nr:hypothetical protein [Chthoniobacter sp.]